MRLYRLLALLLCVLFSPALHADDQFAESNNAFAVDMYMVLRQQDGNLFFSPAAISAATGMAYMGAKGDTAKEIAHALHFSGDTASLGTQLKSWMGLLNAKRQGYDVSAANGLWAAKGTVFTKEYLDALQHDFQIVPQEVNFTGNTASVRDTIDSWAKKQTDGKLPAFFPRNLLNASDQLVIASTAYFKGEWDEGFEKDHTLSEPFNTSSGSASETLLMNRLGTYNYYDGGMFQMAELPYRGKAWSLVVILPKTLDGLVFLEQSLTANSLKEWLSQLKPADNVQMTLPKFKIVSYFPIETALDMRDVHLAFDPVKADFETMSGAKGLSLSKFGHKAMLEVDEEGVIAPAKVAPASADGATSRPHPKMAPVFKADHPFIFLIRDNTSGLILFMGRVIDPASYMPF